MKTGTKVWLISAFFLVLIGLVLFAGVMTRLDWDFRKLETAEYETNAYDIDEAFDRISVNTDTADVLFALAEDGKCRVECYEEKDAKHSVTVEDGALNIKLIDKRAVYDLIGLSFDTPKITVCLPKAEYASLFIDGNTGNVEIPKGFNFSHVEISLTTGDVSFGASASETVKIKTGTGGICVENTSAGELDLTASTGRVTVSGVTCVGDVAVAVSTGKAKFFDTRCRSVISSGSTGEITLENVIASEKFTIERSTGDVKLENSDAAEIYVTTDTGDVNGTILSDKVFITKTDTGRVSVPSVGLGGRCEITTDTGDIFIKVVS